MQMHFRKGYPIKRPWTFCPHLVQSLKVFGAFQWHWTKFQCHQNQVVTVTTWEDLCGAGQIDRHHFIVIKNRVYSVFWGFRYVRMYRFCTHVHSKKAKSSHIQDFGCSHAGNSQVSCSIRNVSKGVGDSPPPRWQGKGVVKHDSLNKISSACDQIGHSQFKGVTNGYALWSLSPNRSVLALYIRT